MKRTAIVVAALVALAVTPAFAAKKASAPAAKRVATTCTSENMAKTTGALSTMPDGPAKFALAREMGAVNSDISKGNMRGACAHYAKAQKMTGGK
jgi:hypothetical protein